MKFKSGDRVLVHEISFSWTGTVIYTQRGFGPDEWLYVRPDEYGVHVRRGSGSSQFEQNLIGVPLFLNKVDMVAEEFSPYATCNS